MWTFIKSLFGSSGDTGKALETAADGLYNGIDKLIYTDEEKADALAEVRPLFLKFAEKAYDQNSIRSITRRWLAFMVVGPTMTFFCLAALFYGFGLFVEDSTAWTNYSTFLFGLAKTLVPWAGGVLVFYFGPHLIGAMPGKR